jgi:wyosine [tRNA(Phe)-imidazoG37] synthetase (radical SAM superfamily)
LLTNGTLFHLPEVRSDVLPFDYILPSLDAISPEIFALINRNHKALDVNAMIEGLIIFARQYTGTIWVEVFIIPGINDSPEELAKFKDILTRIKPARVQLNSLDRPGTESNVQQASPQRLHEIAQYLLPLPVEIIARGAYLVPAPQSDTEAISTIISTIKRRPLSIEEVAALGSITINEASSLLQEYAQPGKLTYDSVTQKWMTLNRG